MGSDLSPRPHRKVRCATPQQRLLLGDGRHPPLPRGTRGRDNGRDVRRTGWSSQCAPTANVHVSPETKNPGTQFTVDWRLLIVSRAPQGSHADDPGAPCLCVTRTGTTGTAREVGELLTGAQRWQDPGMTQCRTRTMCVLWLPPPPREADGRRRGTCSVVLIISVGTLTSPTTCSAWRARPASVFIPTGFVGTQWGDTVRPAGGAGQ